MLCFILITKGIELVIALVEAFQLLWWNDDLCRRLVNNILSKCLTILKCSPLHHEMKLMGYTSMESRYSSGLRAAAAYLGTEPEVLINTSVSYKTTVEKAVVRRPFVVNSVYTEVSK